MLSELATVVLSSEAALAALAEWVFQAGDCSTRALDEVLCSSLRLHSLQHLRDVPYHQVELGWDHLQRGVRAQRAQRSIFESALLHLTESLLADDHGRVALRWQSLEVARQTFREIEISQLSAFHMVCRSEGLFGATRGPRSEELRAWSRDAVIPPIASSVTDEIARRGLVDVHRHMNLSAQPIILWAELMTLDRLPDRLDGKQRRWVRMAQHLRLSLDASNRSKHGALQDVRRAFWLRDGQYRTAVASCRSVHRSPLVSVVREREFLHDVLNWMLSTGSDAARAAVHTYCVLQNLLLKDVVMRSVGGQGLDRFVDVFNGHPIRAALERESTERLVQAFRSGNVWWLEGRLTPDGAADKVDRMAAALRERELRQAPAVLRSAPGQQLSGALPTRRPCPAHSLPAVGLVLHFVKRRDAYRPSQGVWRLPHRNEKEREDAWRQTNEVAELLTRDSRASSWILGFDVCGSEAWTSMDTYACQLRYLKSVGGSRGDHPARLLPSDSGGLTQRKIGLTCHAGEDFVHLLTGLRHIDEAIEYHGLERGDRLGHATAAGVDVGRWLARIGPRCILRQGEWLDDLVWFHENLAEIGCHDGVRHQAQAQIQTICRRVYGAGERAEVQALWGAWQLRAEEPLSWGTGGAVSGWVPGSAESARIGELGGRRFAARSRRERLRVITRTESHSLWCDYHTHPTVRKAWDEPLEIEVDVRWGPALEEVQRHLLEKIIRRHLVIEANPSSNVTLGPFDKMSEHPIFRWLDPRADLPSQRGPLVTVGTDDPSVFGTELIHEYAFLGRAAEELGATPRQVQAWLEHLRQVGIQYSFFPRSSFDDT